MPCLVTLTSTAGRLPVLRYTLLSLQEQTLAPDRIILFLSAAPYMADTGVDTLPEWLAGLAAEGRVEIRWVENTGPYRKLVPVYHEASSEDLIVTCDDDVIYGSGWLEALTTAAQIHPDKIICGRARQPKRNILGRWQSYLNWPMVPEGTVGKELLPIGVAGVVYRKALLDAAMMASSDFLTLAPRQDDLWFTMARKAVGASVLVASHAAAHVYPFEAPGALSLSNMAIGNRSRHLLTALVNGSTYRLRKYAGMIMCDNDLAIRRLEAYRRNLPRHAQGNRILP